MPIYKFTPDLQDPEELKKMFVGREKLLKDILRKIEEAIAKGTSKNCILIGPRGIGKTHLLLLIYFSVNESKLKNRLVPIKFAEEEYSISDLADITLKILEQLNEKEGVPDLEFIETLRKKGKTEILEDSLQFIRKFIKDRSKRLLLLLENLQLIFHQFDDKDIGRFRDILQRENLFIIIGSAPTFFDRIANYEEPFYNFFETIYLNELSMENVEKLIKKMAEYEESDILKNFKDFRPRIKAISILTGGNPRLVLLLYQIITESKLVEIENALLELLDEMTPFFQARMESLPAQQRKILDTLALMDGPATPTEIAKTSRIQVNKVTSQLKRLEEAGYVKTADKYKKKKIVRYEVRERLFRIWREMRTPFGKKRISLLVKFLEIWYTPEELISEYKRIEKDIDKVFKLGRSEEAKDSLKHLCYIHEAVPMPLKHEIRQKLIDKFIEVGDVQGAKGEIEKIELQANKERDPRKRAKYFEEMVSFYIKVKDYRKALKTVDNLLKITPETSYFWGLRGSLLREFGRYDEALKSLSKAIELDPNSHAAYHFQGNVLSGMGKHKEALNSLDKAIELDSDCATCWSARGEVLSELNKKEEALKSFDKAIEIDPNGHAVYVGKAFVFHELDKLKEALKSIDKAIELDANSAFYWTERGLILKELNKKEEALKSFDKAIELDPNSHAAYHFQGNVLSGMGKHKEALNSLDKAIELASDCTTCWSARGEVLLELNRKEEALKSFNRAVELDPKNPITKCYYGIALRRLRKYREALKNFEEAIDLDLKCECPRMWTERARSLSSLRKYEDALKSVEKAIEISKEKNYVENLNESTNLFVSIALKQSIYYLKKEKYDEALESLKKSIQFSKEERRRELDRKLEKVFIGYLRKIASTKNYEFTEKALDMIIETLNENYEELLMPFSKALEYIRTRDKEILETLQQEVRDAVIEIVKDISDIKIEYSA